MGQMSLDINGDRSGDGEGRYGPCSTTDNESTACSTADNESTSCKSRCEIGVIEQDELPTGSIHMSSKCFGTENMTIAHAKVEKRCVARESLEDWNDESGEDAYKKAVDKSLADMEIDACNRGAADIKNKVRFDPYPVAESTTH